MSDMDDPFKPLEPTALRPRPGAGRRGLNEPAARPAAPAGARPVSAPIPEIAGPGLNPLVQSASPLLLLAGQLRSTLSAPDVQGLRSYVLDEIRRFEARARDAGVQKEVVLAARYALCATLDEAVLSTPWGAQGEWGQQTLLVTLHKEAWGGEKFFEMLDRISKDPGRHLDLMELQYFCIALGFSGKYQAQDPGGRRLAEVQQALARQIRDRRGAPAAELSVHWRGLEDRRNPVIRYVPWWVVGAAALAVLAVAFAVYYAKLGSSAAAVHEKIVAMGLDTPMPVVEPGAGPSLRERLAAEVTRRELTVEEEGGRTRITLIAPNLFASGSAVPNLQEYGPLIVRVSEVLAAVPGRVSVEGHTDDQRLKSLRFANNYELSLERAASIGRELQKKMDPGRVAWIGAGASRPRDLATDSAARARNRRVEIVYTPGV